MIEVKQKVNICFSCGDIAFTTEHHVKEHGEKYTVELCPKCHGTLNHYQQEALKKLEDFIEKSENS